jgi:plasmid stabilization system protein ParE
MASRYEIQFSDAARADFDRLQSRAEYSSEALRQLLEIHALLDQIAEGDHAGDSLIPGTLPEPTLRCRSEGGMYMYFRRLDETRTAIVVLFRELHSTDQIALSAPSAAPKLTDLRIRDISHGLETESATEFIGEDGIKRRMRSFVRKVDWGDSYTVFNHVAIDGQPPRTMITSGRKGQIEGDWRRDVIEVVELLADGSARSYPPQTVPVWLRNPFYEATSKKDMLDRLRKGPIPSARLEEIQRLLENDSDSA